MEMAARAQEAAQLRQRRDRRVMSLLLLPASFWLVLFFLIPLGVVLVYSFMSTSPNGQVVARFSFNYSRLLNRDNFIIFRQSLMLALANTLVAATISYPMAYFISRRARRWRGLFLMLVIVPFWTNFLVRTYAWSTLLRNSGLINLVLMSIGLIDEPIRMLYTPGAVLVGLIYDYTPFMLLPIYANLEKFDYALMEAAYDCGANDFRAFLRVLLPLSMPGIVAGSILVFIPSISAYIIGVILGGQKVVMIGDLITKQFTAYRDWPLASAMSITLMIVVTIGVTIYFRITSEADRR